MMPVLAVCLAALVGSGDAETPAIGVASALVEPAPSAVHPFRLLDQSADVLVPGEYEVGVLYGRLSRGLFPGFQASAHLAAYLIGFVNLNGKYLLVDLPELRLSIDAGVWWLASGRLIRVQLLYVPVELRASVPLPKGFEANFAFQASFLEAGTNESTLRSAGLGAEATLVRYDSIGAWFLQGKVPLVAGAGGRFALYGATFEGMAPFGNLAAWSVMVGRDQKIGRSAHLRVGVGYRNRPGIVVVESLGPVAYNLDFYWRF